MVHAAERAPHHRLVLRSPGLVAALPAQLVGLRRPDAGDRERHGGDGRALESVDPEIVPYFVDATDLFDTDEPEFEDEARRRQEIVFLALDLVSGRIDERHLLWPWLLKNGARESELELVPRQCGRDPGRSA